MYLLKSPAAPISYCKYRGKHCGNRSDCSASDLDQEAFRTFQQKTKQTAFVVINIRIDKP